MSPRTLLFWLRHTVIGIWCAPVLLVLTLTGAIMSYQWASNLLYTLTGNEPPPPAPAPGPAAPSREGQRRPRVAETGRAPVGLDTLWARAERQVQSWVAINARLPQQPDGPVTFFIQEPTGWHPAPRSQLVLDAVSGGAALVWTGLSRAWQRFRTWHRPPGSIEAILVPEANQEVSAD